MTLPQDLKDDINKIKTEAEAAGKQLLLSVEDFAAHAKAHGEEAVRHLLDLLRAKVSG